MYAIINEKVELNGVKKMKDIKVIITRAMLAFIAFIAFIMIIIVYAFVGTSEDKGKIRKDEDRMVEYVLENYELKNGDEIKNINKKILKDRNIKKKDKSNDKNNKKLTSYTIFIKDSNNILKDNNNLNYLPDNIIIRIKNFKDKSTREQFKQYSTIWKELDDNVKDKYKKLCEDKNFTNTDYDKITKTKNY